MVPVAFVDDGIGDDWNWRTLKCQETRWFEKGVKRFFL